VNENLLLPEQQRPSRADAVKNREHLLETAQRLFAEQGVDAVSMSMIAEAAGVGKGTLYRHFPGGMVDLCHTLLDSQQRDLQERTLQQLRPGTDPLENLRWFLREVVLFVERNDELLMAGVTVGLTLGHPAHLWWLQTIRGLLNQHFRGTNVDTSYIADMLYTMLDVAVIRFQKQARGYSTTRIIDGLLGVVERLAI
jgi:AcrR family transcriptional regulator